MDSRVERLAVLRAALAALEALVGEQVLAADRLGERAPLAFAGGGDVHVGVGGAESPAARSQIAAPVRIGPCPGAPVTDMRPLMPCAIWSKPGRSRYGPSWPKPEMLARMMRGLIAASES